MMSIAGVTMESPTLKVAAMQNASISLVTRSQKSGMLSSLALVSVNLGFAYTGKIQYVHVWMNELVSLMDQYILHIQIKLL
jgi:DNA primase large subunit